MGTETPERLAESIRRGLLLPELLFTSDLARVLHCSTSAARQLLRKGELPARKVGRRWVTARSFLLEWLDPASVRFRALPPASAPFRLLPRPPGGTP